MKDKLADIKHVTLTTTGKVRFEGFSVEVKQGGLGENEGEVGAILSRHQQLVSLRYFWNATGVSRANSFPETYTPEV